MDAVRFDSLVKALSILAGRRGLIAGLLAGGWSSLQSGLEGGASRHANEKSGRRNGLSAEKGKHKNKKRKKRRKKRKQRKAQNEAPSCTKDSCPLPPGCSQQSLDACALPLMEAMQAGAESCRPACTDGDSPACRACLEPVLAAHLPGAEDCVVGSCLVSADSAAEGNRAEVHARQMLARVWWDRNCGKPTCCYNDWSVCVEQSRREFGDCFVSAGIQCAIASAACLPALQFCMAKLTYDRAKCDASFGCLHGETCGEGDICCSRRHEPCVGACCPLDAQCCPEGGCCPMGETCCPGGGCCAIGDHCCPGGGCCHAPDTCCRRGEQLFCCPPGAQCMQTGIPCCSNC